MSHKRLTFCHVADKYSYSSEAKALKFVERREDLKRAYYCPHCDGYHTTSMGSEDAEKYLGVREERVTSIDDVVKRLQELKTKL